jgi:hypothetical protein
MRGWRTAICRISLRFFSPPEGRHFCLAARLALRVQRRAQEGHVADAGDLDRVLEGEEQPVGGTLLRVHLQQVLAVQRGRAVRHLVAGAARQYVGKGRLARAVRPHDRVHAARFDIEVDALEDDFVFFLKFHVQIFDIKHVYFFSGSIPSNL